MRSQRRIFIDAALASIALLAVAQTASGQTIIPYPVSDIDKVTTREVGTFIEEGTTYTFRIGDSQFSIKNINQDPALNGCPAAGACSKSLWFSGPRVADRRVAAGSRIDGATGFSTQPVKLAYIMLGPTCGTGCVQPLQRKTDTEGDHSLIPFAFPTSAGRWAFGWVDLAICAPSSPEPYQVYVYGIGFQPASDDPNAGDVPATAQNFPGSKHTSCF